MTGLTEVLTEEAVGTGDLAGIPGVAQGSMLPTTRGEGISTILGTAGTIHGIILGTTRGEVMVLTTATMVAVSIITTIAHLLGEVTTLFTTTRQIIIITALVQLEVLAQQEANVPAVVDSY